MNATDLPTFERFTAKIRALILENEGSVTDELKREIMQALNVDVQIPPEGDEIEKVGRFDGRPSRLLNTISTCPGQKPVSFSLRARLL
jgi:hypothetical protein